MISINSGNTRGVCGLPLSAMCVCMFSYVLFSHMTCPRYIESRGRPVPRLQQMLQLLQKLGPRRKSPTYALLFKALVPDPSSRLVDPILAMSQPTDSVSFLNSGAVRQIEASISLPLLRTEILDPNWKSTLTLTLVGRPSPRVLVWGLRSHQRAT